MRPWKDPGESSWTRTALLAASGPAGAQPAPVEITVCADGERADSDRDGLSDTCESALASAFAPILAAWTGSCNWVRSSDSGRLGGGYLHVVQPVGAVVRIAYMPAYFRDCGWSGPKCRIPWVDCSPHAGDSEIIIVEVRRAPNTRTWSFEGVFLSAHCFRGSSRSCRWYRGSDFAGFTWLGATPVIWVSEGRNANYPSWQACDGGHYLLDTCDRHDTWYRFPVDPLRNAGSRLAPRAGSGCILGAELADVLVDPDAEECFWRSDRPFGGWQGSGDGVTPYARYLSEIGEF